MEFLHNYKTKACLLAALFLSIVYLANASWCSELQYSMNRINEYALVILPALFAIFILSTLHKTELTRQEVKASAIITRAMRTKHAFYRIGQNFVTIAFIVIASSIISLYINHGSFAASYC